MNLLDIIIENYDLTEPQNLETSIYYTQQTFYQIFESLLPSATKLWRVNEIFSFSQYLVFTKV